MEPAAAKSANPPVAKPAAKPASATAATAAPGPTTSPKGRKTAKEAAGPAPKKKGPALDAGGHGDAPAGGMSPAEKARLAAVEHRANEHKKAETTHQSSAEATDEAHAAAKEPQKEADGRALGDHAQQLEDNAPPDLEMVLLVLKIKLAIRLKRPVKEEELPKAKPKEMAAAAGKEVSGDVKTATAEVPKAYGPVDQKPAGVPSKQMTPIPADAAAPVAPAVNAVSATPDAVQPSQVSLDADKKTAAAKAKGAKMDREEVALVKDGPVAEARDAQADLNNLAIWGPDAVVKSDKEIRGSATADFKKAEAEALKKMKAARAKELAEVGGSKEGTKTGEEGKREALGKKLAGIYSGAADKVHAKLQPLVPTALQMWDDGIKPLSDNFDHALGRVDAYIKEHKSAFLNRVGDFFLGLPGWIVDEYETAEQTFADGAGKLALTVSSWVNGIIRDCQKIIADGKKEIQKEIDGLDPELKGYALEEQQKIDKQFDGLSQEVTAAKTDFTKQLTHRLVAAVQAKDEQIQKLREMSKGLLQKFEDFVNEFIDDPLRAIINGLLRVVGIPPDSFWALVDKFAKVVDQIADQPKVFANNLVAAMKLGFQQFKDNIASHLIAGLLNWLTSKLKDAGVEAPKDLSLKSILTLFLQILGISWPKIRAKLVKYIGNRNMRLIELGWEFLKTFIDQGWDGVWNLIKEKLDPQQLVDIVLNAVKSFIVETIVKKAAEFVISMFNPAGIIFQVLKLIYNVVSWIIDNAAKIFTLIEAVVDGAANIMSGAIGGAANMIEKALGSIVPIVIDLFAKLVGLGGVPDKVKEVVGGLQDMVSNAIDKVIEWVATKIGLGKPDDKKDADNTAKQPFSLPQEGHTVTAQSKGDTLTITIASDRELDILAMLVEARSEVAADTTRDKEHKARILGDLDGAREAAQSMYQDWLNVPKQDLVFSSWAERRLAQLVNILSQLGADGIKAFRDFKGKPLDKRYLPSGYDVRNKLYLRGSGWSGNRDTVARIGRDEVLKDVDEVVGNRETNPSKAEAAWERLVEGLRVPDGATMATVTRQHVANTQYDVDHMEVLSIHWQSQGGNDSDDGARWTLSDQNKLRYITQRDNINRMKGRYVPDVGQGFSSVYAEGGLPNAKKIDGQPMLDALNGQPL